MKIQDIKKEWDKAQGEHLWDETNRPLTLIARSLWKECQKYHLEGKLVKELYSYSQYDTFAWD